MCALSTQSCMSVCLPPLFFFFGRLSVAVVCVIVRDLVCDAECVKWEGRVPWRWRVEIGGRRCVLCVCVCVRVPACVANKLVFLQLFSRKFSWIAI